VAFAEAVESLAKGAEAGDVAFASRALAAKALTLDAIFVEFTRRSALNLGSHRDAAELYTRFSLRAQANSRATRDASARLHQPREQIVRHVHVNEGGQVIVADHVNHFAGGVGIAGSIKQSHASSPIAKQGPPGDRDSREE
jgi:hypothetical protein